MNLWQAHTFAKGESYEAAAFPGCQVMHDPANIVYPMPLFAAGKDDCYVGRIRDDESAEALYGNNLRIMAGDFRRNRRHVRSLTKTICITGRCVKLEAGYEYCCLDRKPYRKGEQECL